MFKQDNKIQPQSTNVMFMHETQHGKWIHKVNNYTDEDAKEMGPIWPLHKQELDANV